MKNRKWSDLSRTQRIMIIVMGAIEFSLMASAMADIYRSPTQEVNGSKRKWYSIALISWVGPISWFLWGRKRLPVA